MMRTKIMIGFLIAIIAILSAILFVDLTSGSRSTILHRFDKAEINRLNEMVIRHQQGGGRLSHAHSANHR